MRHRHVAGVATAALMTFVALAGGSAGAQEEPGEFAPLTVDPTSGPPGTVISVSGDGCATEDPALIPVAFGFMFRLDDELTEDDFLAAGDVEASPDGTWATSLTVPDGFDPEGIYAVGAVCAGIAETPEDDQLLVDYEPVEFDLTGPPPTEPPVVTPPDLPPVVPVAPAAPAAAPVATAVQARPSFAG
jgi:hypothetical protein